MTTCEDCGWPMRPRGSRASEHPGTHAPQSKTRCEDCARRERYGIPLPGHDYECSQCHQQVDTSYGSRKGVLPSSGGVCRTCKRTAGKRPTPQCRECGRTFVPRSVTPGPKECRHRGNGLCNRDYQRAQKAAKRGPLPAPKAPKAPRPPRVVVSPAAAVAAQLSQGRAERAARAARLEQVRLLEYARRLTRTTT